MVVDDERDIAESIRDLLVAELQDIDVRTAHSGLEALDLLETDAVDLIISDYRMPGLNGIEFLNRARMRAPTAPRILVTAYPDLALASAVLQETALDRLIVKPFSTGVLVDAVRQALARRGTEPRRRPWPASGPTATP